MEQFVQKLLSESPLKEQRARYDRLLASLGQPDLAKTKTFLADREPDERESGLTDEMIARVEEDCRKCRRMRSL